MNDQLRKKLALWILAKIAIALSVFLIMRRIRKSREEDDAS